MALQRRVEAAAGEIDKAGSQRWVLRDLGLEVGDIERERKVHAAAEFEQPIGVVLDKAAGERYADHGQITESRRITGFESWNVKPPASVGWAPIVMADAPRIWGPPDRSTPPLIVSGLVASARPIFWR